VSPFLKCAHGNIAAAELISCMQREDAELPKGAARCTKLASPVKIVDGSSLVIRLNIHLPQTPSLCGAPPIFPPRLICCIYSNLPYFPVLSKSTMPSHRTRSSSRDHPRDERQTRDKVTRSHDERDRGEYRSSRHDKDASSWSERDDRRDAEYHRSGSSRDLRGNERDRRERQDQAERGEGERKKERRDSVTDESGRERKRSRRDRERSSSSERGLDIRKMGVQELDEGDYE
jgi:hypothetical protein